MVTEVPLKIITSNSKQQRTALYATGADFCRIFVDDMKNLYLLSLVLTADPEKAEQCFVSGLDDCTAGNQVFGEWARSWARRVVIKNAIRAILPRPERPARLSSAAAKPQVHNQDRLQTVPTEIAGLFDLPDFERFVFVMSVLERYSDQDCALLLGYTRETVSAARLEALERIRNRETSKGLNTEAGRNVESMHDHRASVGEFDLRDHLATPA